MSKVKSQSQTYSSGIEQVKELAVDTVKQTANEFANIGGSIFFELLGLITPNTSKTKETTEKQQATKKTNVEERNLLEQTKQPISRFENKVRLRPNEGAIHLFSAYEYHEKYEVPQRIQQILERIRQEIEAFRKTTDSINAEVENIAKVTLNQREQKLGQYDISFFEFLLSLIRDLRQKAAESRSWLLLFKGKMQKRGSLFLPLKKKKKKSSVTSEDLITATGSN
ncbi:MAG: hypothetical protein KatS3mg090_0496 [Patescibacteria group bacterium]|nr:MAG: hypothetical protein KatS3mg090_0496 [Patescibacteria group bacterium]